MVMTPAPDQRALGLREPRGAGDWSEQRSVADLPEQHAVADRPNPGDGPARPVRLHTRRHALGLDLGQVAVLQVGLILLVLASLAGRVGFIVGLVLALVTVVLALARRQGRWLLDGLLVGHRFRRRQRALRQPMPGRRAEGLTTGLAPVGDTLTGPLTGLAPMARLIPLSGRTGTRYSVLHDGRRWCVVGELRTSGGPLLRRAYDVTVIPVEQLLRDLGGDAGIALTVQLVQTVVPAPAPTGSGDLVAADSYPQAGRSVPARRRTWVAVGVDALASQRAIVVRGGGSAGLASIMLRCIDHLNATLSASGFTFLPASAEQIDAELGAALAGAPGPGRPGSDVHQPAERRTAVQVGDAWHRCFAISRWPDLAQTSLDSVICALPGPADCTTTVSLTLQPREGLVQLCCLIRLTAATEPALEAASQLLVSATRQAGLRLSMAHSEQLPAVLRSLPTAGVLG